MCFKKLIGAFSALVLLVGLAACGGSDEGHGGHLDGGDDDFNSQSLRKAIDELLATFGVEAIA